MKKKSNATIIYPILSSLTGMILGFTIFIITEKIIFLIVFVTIGLTLGIAIGQQKENEGSEK